MKKVTLSILFAIALTAPAAAQTPPAKVSADDVKKLIATIDADEKQIKAYCDMSKLYEEAYEAGEKKDEKKAEELATKADEMGKSLGGDYERIMDGLQEVDPTSEEGKVIIATFEPLEKKCQQ